MYPIYARAYGLATLARLSLPDAMEGRWLLVALVHLAGASMLLFNGCILGWLLCLIGALSGVLWLGDVLTQSAYLVLCALSALGCAMAQWRGRDGFLRDGLPVAIRVVTVGFYAWAVIHKLNRDFLDSGTSCANGGLERLVSSSRFVEFSQWFGATLATDARAWPIVYVAIELGVVALLLRRPAWGVLCAAMMHVPLTIIFAPSFALVMASGWVCFFRIAELEALGRSFRHWWRWILLVAGGAWCVSQRLFFVGRWSTDPDWCIKEGLVWILVVWLGLTIVRRADAQHEGDFRGPGVWLDRAARPEKCWALVMGLLVVANGLTPYLGLQFHHTGAMLSNLRIDAACHNSLIFPLGLQVRDPYVRIESIGLAPGPTTADSVAYIQSRLFSMRALYRARRRWCAKQTEALVVTVTHGGRRVEVPNLCAEQGWPFGLPLPMRRFQATLPRTCHQRCIH